MNASGEWHPDAESVGRANLTHFMQWLSANGAGDFVDYPSLQQMSVDDTGAFWGLIWDYFGVGDRPTPDVALVGDQMPDVRWFPDAEVNYTREVFRHETTRRPAIISVGEDSTTTWSWARLRQETATFSAYLRELGVGVGDRVVGYLPNIGETVAAFLGTAAVGAVWASCNPDVPADGVIDRLGQLEPAVLVAVDGSMYNGKPHDRHAELEAIRAAIPSLRATVVVDRIGRRPETGDLTWWSDIAVVEAELATVAVPFEHPLWVLFSSGTTGKPKGIMHGHGGVVLEHLKYLHLQLDLQAGDRFMWYTTTSWMMWNLQVSGLLVDTTIVLYDGSPTYPAVDGLWRLVSENDVDVFGTGAGYLLTCAKDDGARHRDYSLDRLRAVGSTGSPLPPEGFRWVQDMLGRQIPVISMSGGTDVVTAFLGGCPLMPIRPGELNALCLGAAIESWDIGGQRVSGEAGELVLTKPMPSMPVAFWNDPDRQRLRDSYFGRYPGIWYHGDWLTLNDSGSVVVHGRSDATLNKGGVRMGSGDIYNVVERISEVDDCLVVGVEQSDGGYWMPLFVSLADGVELGDELRVRIAAEIRRGASPRHVPDDVVEVAGLPRTLTGKRLEVPIKRILQGADPTDVVAAAAVDRPELLDAFTRFARA